MNTYTILALLLVVHMLKCVSCKREVTDNYIKFKCPNCGREIIRCHNCREIAARYTCPECGLEGP